jgi:hypothetical protein
MSEGNTNDPNQVDADQVRQRGTDATVDLGKEPGEQQSGEGVQQERGTPKPYSGDVRDTVNDDVEESANDDA